MEWLVHNYLTRGFWRDEAWTALISSLPISEIIRITGEDFHPPLYYLLVHGFVGLFGASEFIRLISTWFWILIPLPVFGLLRRSAGKTVAMGGTFLVLASPILFIYAFEARSYALLTFLSVLTSWCFWKGMATKRSVWLITYSVGAIAGVYTHYYMWFVIAAHGVSWLWLYRKRLGTFVILLGSILVAQMPWIPILLSQVSSVKQNYWIRPIDAKTYWEWFVVIMGGDIDQPQRMLVVWVLLILGIASPILVRWRYQRWPKGYMYLWIWLLVPVLIPTIISLTFKPVFFYRYLVFSCVPWLLIVVWGMAAVRKSMAYGGVAFLLAFYLSLNWLNFSRYPGSMREEMEIVFSDSREAKLLVTYLLPFAEVVYYNHDRLPVRVTPLDMRQDYGKALLDAYVRLNLISVAEAPTDQSYWLVNYGVREYHEGKRDDE